MKKNKISNTLLTILAFVMIFSITNVAFAAPYVWPGNFPLTQQGASGGYVRAVQDVCKYSVPVSGLAVDGAFGSGTKSAVIAYQELVGLLPADGIVGYNTWASMQTELSVYYDYPQIVTGNFKLYQYSSGTYTNTSFFRRLSTFSYRWDVYKAAPGSDPGTWYIIVN